MKFDQKSFSAKLSCQMDLEVGKKRFQLNGDHGHDDDTGVNIVNFDDLS